MDKAIFFLLGFTLLLLAAIYAFAVNNHGRHYRFRRRADRIYRKFNSEQMPPRRMIAYLRKINPYVFEELVLTAFERKGYGVRRNRRYSGDGGVDGRIIANGYTVFLQCKRYVSHIDSSDVAAFARLCLDEKVTGLFVHTGRTGRRSREIARSYRNITFISGDTLIDLMMKDRKIDIRPNML